MLNAATALLRAHAPNASACHFSASKPGTLASAPLASSLLGFATLEEAQVSPHRSPLYPKLRSYHDAYPRCTLQEACVVLDESCTGVVTGGGDVHGGRYYRVCGGIEMQPSPTGEHTSFKLGCGSGARRLEGGALTLQPYVTEAATLCHRMQQRLHPSVSGAELASPKRHPRRREAHAHAHAHAKPAAVSARRYLEPSRRRDAPRSTDPRPHANAKPTASMARLREARVRQASGATAAAARAAAAPLGGGTNRSRPAAAPPATRHAWEEALKQLPASGTLKVHADPNPNPDLDPDPNPDPHPNPYPDPYPNPNAQGTRVAYAWCMHGACVVHAWYMLRQLRACGTLRRGYSTSTCT